MSEEQELTELSFIEAMQGVTPLTKQDKVFTATVQPTLAQRLKREALQKEQNCLNNYLTSEYVEPLDPYDFLEYKKCGVQAGVYKNLRLAKYKIEQVLNLQNLKFEQARQTLFAGLIDAHRQNKRVLLIKHGLGLHSKPFPGLLKSYVFRWLQQMPEVLALHSAQSRHGGVAAVYILVKKSEDEKLANRERHK